MPGCLRSLAGFGAPDTQRHKTEAGSTVYRRLIYFVRDLRDGAVVTADEIHRIRSGMGLPTEILRGADRPVVVAGSDTGYGSGMGYVR